MMGIAYAALTDNLFIKGEASLKTDVAQVEFDADVYFVAQCTDGTHKSDKIAGNGTSTIPEGKTESVVLGQSDPDSATFYVYSLGKANDYVVFSFVIQNDSAEYDAIVSLDAHYPSTTAPELFTIEYSVDNTTWVEADSGTSPETTCAAGDNTVVYVKVTLNGTPDQNTTAAFNVNLTATSDPV